MYQEKLELLIDGTWRQGSEGVSEPLINPATEETLSHVPHASTSDLDQALSAAAKGFKVWKKKTAAERYAVLYKAAELIEARKDSIAEVLSLENGKPVAEAAGEIMFSAEALRFYAEEGKRAYGRIIPSRTPGVRQIVMKEPIGPVLAFTAWNFPASNVIRKLGGALAAGCSIIIKPAEETPGTAVAFGRCLQDAGLPDGVLNIVFGDPAVISSHLIASPIPKAVTLTGSTAVGKLLQKQAADTLKRCLMELGGHAPVIVHKDADLEKTLDMIVMFKFRNAGQVCTSPTRFYVHESLYEKAIAGFVERVKKIKIGQGNEEGTQMGPMIAERRLGLMDELVQDAVLNGAKIVTGGERLDRKGYFYAPTVLRDVPDTARIMSEEPFGPIAPFTSFSDFETLMERANSTVYGLASFVFTQDGALARKTEEALEAGMVGVNFMGISTPETPFGGVNQSGDGSESGIEGLEEYMRVKFIAEL
ncbi:NAD-dependent succinate-semialdehyde dehydrogenase [Falsihalocynthiibacter arcticus]|uniref:NAD-dependent succinate-semialdehyde dehydrogenase n=1 Tax=Falsihalocynthiibacter arcticus TaxID=1579316 RepID=A0A126UWK5_9RHOB|nr:NAD-dependent succinate-semialdehyde dehydrogenase [Falsihalocynthiibacter arcticus]AML50430.1 NAD-dependent succinate-semialdehyde dehydrogenase [Falsihalocynthiibacter arcticus]